MLAAARARLPDARFLEGDAAHWRVDGADLVFANAVFHWVPGPYRASSRGSPAELPPGGCLAAQMPDNEAEPTPCPDARDRRAASPSAQSSRARAARARRSAPSPITTRRFAAIATTSISGARFICTGSRAPRRSSHGSRARACAPISRRLTPDERARISRALSRGDRKGLSAAAVGRRAAAVPAPVPRRAARGTWLTEALTRRAG